MKKVSKAYFEKFKTEFLRLQKELGLMQYRIEFRQERLGDNYAAVEINETGKYAVVALTNIINNPKNDTGPESHAKHEIIMTVDADTFKALNINYQIPNKPQY